MKRKDAVKHSVDTDGPLADSELVRQRRLQRFYSEPVTLDAVREEGQAGTASSVDEGEHISSEESLGPRLRRGVNSREDTNDTKSELHP